MWNPISLFLLLSIRRYSLGYAGVYSPLMIIWCSMWRVDKESRCSRRFCATVFAVFDLPQSTLYRKSSTGHISSIDPLETIEVSDETRISSERIIIIFIMSVD